MEYINFSHWYYKFWGMDITKDNACIVMQCLKVNQKDLSENFIVYDTVYRDNGINNWYKLPKGTLILLILKHRSSGRVFTTIRRYTERKFTYYKAKEGQTIHVRLKLKVK